MGDSNVIESFSLKNKTIVITGGAGGLGQALIRGLAQVGANIAVIDDHEMSNTIFSKLSYGGTYRYYKADVTNHAGLGRIFDDIFKDFGNIHGW